MLSRVPTPTPPSTDTSPQIPDEDDGNLTDLLGEMRVLLSGVQTMTAFLILLPFNVGFDQVSPADEVVYGITFVCSVSTRYMIAGMAPLTIATFMVTQLVFSVIIPIPALAWVSAGLVALLLLTMWWIIPLRRKRTTAKT
jgi:uncharacterized membrane protein